MFGLTMFLLALIIKKMTNKMTKGAIKLRNWPWVIFGICVIIVVFGFGGLWASFTKISGAVIAQGTIGVESKVKTIQHLDGGIVIEMFVRDGDRVEVGDSLLRLDETSLRANLNIINNNLFELVARENRLEAENNAREIIDFSGELTKNKQLPLVEQIMKSNTAFFATRKNTRNGQEAMMRKKIEQLNEQIKGLEAQINAKNEQTKILEQNIAKKEPAVERGVISQDDMDQLKTNFAELTGRIGELQSNVAQIGITIAETELQILQINIVFIEQVQQELREVITKISELSEQKIAYEERLQRTLVTAPVTGLVHNMSIHTIGGVISPSKAILQIIPNNDRLIIEARIQTMDIDQVHIGQISSVHLSAFDARTTPVLNGKVMNISAAQIIDEATKIPYFSVEIEIPKNELKRLNKDQVLLPGMPAEAYIKTGERTPLDYFLKPLKVQLMRAFKEE